MVKRQTSSRQEILPASFDGRHPRQQKPDGMASVRLRNDQMIEGDAGSTAAFGDSE